MVLGKLPVPGVLLNQIRVGQGPTALAVGAAGGCLDILFSRLSRLFLPLWEMARYRLKYCLKGPKSPKQPTNQPTFEARTTSSQMPFTDLLELELHTDRYQQLLSSWLIGCLRFNGPLSEYSQLSLSRLRLSRITAYIEEKIWSLF